MSKKIFTMGILAIIFAFAGNAYAASQKNNANATGDQLQQIMQIENQIQKQNNFGAQAGTSTGTQIQQQEQQRLQDGSADGEQVQNRNQINNQGLTNQIKTKEQEGTLTQARTGTGSAVAEQRRSEVANAVQKMLQIAGENTGIGQQVRVIAQAQKQNQEKLETNLRQAQNRNALAKFLFGPDYSAIKNAKKILEQNRQQIMQLNQIKNQLNNQGDQKTLTEQIQTLEQANIAIANSLETTQEGFSLLGWMFKLFSR